MPQFTVRQHLIFDADDTLWENNIYYEQIIHEFIQELERDDLHRDQIRTVLDEFERTNGYGARAFARSLGDTFAHFSPESSGDRARVEEMGLHLLEIEYEPIADVERTLRALRPHHDLYLFTKGEDEEQRLKIERSRIAPLFDAHMIAPEKTPRTYSDIVESFGLDLSRTWMIGNSEKSDIYPALEAGLHTIYVPHEHTWHLEYVSFEAHPDWKDRSYSVEHFSDLLTLFAHDGV